MKSLEDKSFLALLILISLAFGWVILPFSGAILWGVVAAILFAPVNGWLLRHMPKRQNTAALITLLLIIAIVIVPALILSVMMVNEATAAYRMIASGKIDFGAHLQHVRDVMPDWVRRGLDGAGLWDLDALRGRLREGLATGLQGVAGRLLNIGQSAAGFVMALGVMLYLTYFLLRDGDALAKRIDRTAPLHAATRRALISTFVAVMRATIKGSVVVAIVQGLIGGMTFWFLGIGGALLWGVTMGFFSLLPAIGTGIIWVPVAIYLLATGAVWQGVVLILCGVLIIGMVDNVLRPILVGRDTRMPDYVVLISTLGGLQLFGFNGIVIGPVIAALFMTVWTIFAEQRNGELPEAPGES